MKITQKEIREIIKNGVELSNAQENDVYGLSPEDYIESGFIKLLIDKGIEITRE